MANPLNSPQSTLEGKLSELRNEIAVQKLKFGFAAHHIQCAESKLDELEALLLHGFRNN